jgi:toxin ParE1/3/4
MLPLRWTERAVNNLADIADFISQNSPMYAEGVVLRIDQQLALLRSHPLLGKPAREASDLMVRELVIDSFRVFYRPRPDCIELLAIVHGRQQPPLDVTAPR